MKKTRKISDCVRVDAKLSAKMLGLRGWLVLVHLVIWETYMVPRNKFRHLLVKSSPTGTKSNWSEEDAEVKIHTYCGQYKCEHLHGVGEALEAVKCSDCTGSLVTKVSRTATTIMGERWVPSCQ